MTAKRLGKGKKKSRPLASFVTVPSQESHQRETTGSDSSHVPTHKTHKTQEREKLPLDFCHFGHSANLSLVAALPIIPLIAISFHASSYRFQVFQLQAPFR